MRVLSAREVVKKALKKGKDNIFHTRLGYISETHNKRIISIIDNINGDLTKIYFCELYISIKITRNLGTKSMSKITTKLDRVHMDL